MPIIEDIKKLAEKATGIRRPGKRELADLVRERKPSLARFADDGSIPNHPRWPLVHYRAAVALPDGLDPAAIFEDLFASNGWRDSWRNGVYDYLHYHSRIHEVMGIARGTAVVQFGGRRGRKLWLKAGDVVALPAGTGHQCFSSSKDFLVVGAYPATGKYDVYRTSPDEHGRAVKTVPGCRHRGAIRSMAKRAGCSNSGGEWRGQRRDSRFRCPFGVGRRKAARTVIRRTRAVMSWNENEGRAFLASRSRQHRRDPGRSQSALSTVRVRRRRR